MTEFIRFENNLRQTKFVFCRNPIPIDSLFYASVSSFSRRKTLTALVLLLRVKMNFPPIISPPPISTQSWYGCVYVYEWSCTWSWLNQPHSQGVVMGHIWWWYKILGSIVCHHLGLNPLQSHPWGIFLPPSPRRNQRETRNQLVNLFRRKTSSASQHLTPIFRKFRIFLPYRVEAFWWHCFYNVNILTLEAQLKFICVYLHT